MRRREMSSLVSLTGWPATHHRRTVRLIATRARSSMVEQGTHNPLVVGSNPTGPTTNPHWNRAPLSRPVHVRAVVDTHHGDGQIALDAIHDTVGAAARSMVALEVEPK